MTDDPKFKAALVDFPKSVERYKQLTKQQWAFFSVIHNKCTGAWPPDKQEFAKEDPPLPPRQEQDLDLDTDPF